MHGCIRTAEDASSIFRGRVIGFRGRWSWWWNLTHSHLGGVLVWIRFHPPRGVDQVLPPRSPLMLLAARRCCWIWILMEPTTAPEMILSQINGYSRRGALPHAGDYSTLTPPLDGSG